MAGAGLLGIDDHFGVARPAMVFSRVDLPEPVSPAMAKRCFLLSVKEIPGSLTSRNSMVGKNR
jgi:hypothetical protein